MKRLIATIAVLLVSAAPARAAQDVTPAQTDRAGERLEQMKDRLHLTPEQVEQVRPVLVDEMQKLKAVRDKHNDSGQNRRARLKSAREARRIQDKADEQLSKILSKQQMEELKKIREERREQLRDRAGEAQVLGERKP